jgi:hypothetical protein
MIALLEFIVGLWVMLRDELVEGAAYTRGIGRKRLTRSTHPDTPTEEGR